MGNFLSKAWDKFTGADQAKKAEKLQRESMAIQQQDSEYNKKLLEAINGQYGDLLTPLLDVLQGKSPTAGTPAAQTRDSMLDVLDILSGKNITDEQARTNQLADNYITQLLAPYSSSEQQYADGLARDYIGMLTKPMDTSKSKEQQTADKWNSSYLNSLANNPDTAFNAGVTELARGMQRQNENVRKAMQNRGIGSSGIAVDKLGSTGADYAKGVSQLQGQRLDRQAANNGQGAQFAQGLADKALAVSQNLQDRQLNQFGQAANTAQTLAQQAENRADKNLQNYGNAMNVANNLAQNRQNNLTNAMNVANSYQQQNLNNIMNILSGQTSLINKQAGSQYLNSINGLADSYYNQALQQSNAAGRVMGNLATLGADSSNKGVKNLSKILGLIGIG